MKESINVVEPVLERILAQEKKSFGYLTTLSVM